LGRNTQFAFTQLSKAVTSGTYTLTASEASNVIQKYTGTLTGNVTIVVPATVQQYWVSNNTTGPFTLTVKTAAGTGVAIAQNARSILYCNGTNVVAADTGGLSVPISVAQGGTGATTSNGALVNLGGTSLGVSIFTAAGTANVWADLGPAQSGNVNGGTF
jgi:hypothetical protein